MAAELFDCEFSEVTFLSHAKAFSIANHVSCSIEAMTLMAEFKKELVATPEGEPWLCATDRSLAFCNYVAYCEKTFTLQDVWADESFAWVKALKGIRFYSGSPVVVRGLTIATLCVYDFRRAHPEFTRAHQIQQERLAELVSQHLENWVVRQEMGHIRQPVCKTKSLAPEYLAAVVFTKVYGFESLMKADPFAAKESLQLYCQILRDNINDHDGYEVSSEHDSFQIVFQDCHKAISFAIGVQEKLHEAPWCDDILRLPESNDDGKRFRGLRAHCSIKYGPVTTSYGPSGQREYSGQTVNIAKSILDMTHGGQILTTSTFWQMSNMPTGAVQVIDQGRHILLTGTNLKEGLIEKNIVQLLPPRLAVDYATINDGDLKAEGKVAGGRQFPSLLTMRQLSPSFHEAPFDENQTTMMYLFVQQVEKVYDDPETILSSLAKQIETLLSKSQCGYQSSDFLVAFPTLSHAVTFGLTVQTYLRDHQIGGAQLARLIKIGVHAGSFTSLRPHATTGRAEYVGSVVERVALVAEAAHPGEVVVGMIDDNILELESPLESSFVGSRILKGDNETTDLHVCRFS